MPHNDVGVVYVCTYWYWISASMPHHFPFIMLYRRRKIEIYHSIRKQKLILLVNLIMWQNFYRTGFWCFILLIYIT